MRHLPEIAGEEWHGMSNGWLQTFQLHVSDWQVNPHCLLYCTITLPSPHFLINIVPIDTQGLFTDLCQEASFPSSRCMNIWPFLACPLLPASPCHPASRVSHVKTVSPKKPVKTISLCCHPFVTCFCCLTVCWQSDCNLYSLAIFLIQCCYKTQPAMLWQKNQ